MAAFNNTSFNTLKLTYQTHLNDERKLVDDPADTLLLQMNVTPAGSSIPPAIVKLCDDLSKDYLYHLGNDFNGKVCHAQLIFAASTGISIISTSDPRFKKTLNALKEQAITVLPVDQAHAAGFMGFSQLTPTSEQKAQGEALYPGQKLVYFDITAISIHKIFMQNKLSNPVKVNLEIHGFVAFTEGKGLTTGYLRFPHMLKEMITKIPAEIRTSPDTRVCIIGPGLDTQDKQLPTCPQAAELLSIFPKAHFTLLDNDETALKALDKNRTIQLLSYDATCLRARIATQKLFNTAKVQPRASRGKAKSKRKITPTLLSSISKFAAPESYQKPLHEMACSMADLATFPPNAKEMLTNLIGSVGRVMLKIQKEHLEIREFDITETSFSETEKNSFDIMVGTMSIGNAVSLGGSPPTIRPDAPSIFAKFIDALKIGGRLYVDSDTFFALGGEAIKMLDESKPTLLIEALTGHKLQWKLIPLSDFNPSLSSNVGIIDNFSALGEHKVSTLSTCSIVEIIKLPELVDPEMKQIAIEDYQKRVASGASSSQ